MRALLVLAGIVVLPGPADAGSCSVTSNAGVAFGTYDVYDPSPVASTGSITFECAGMAPTDTVRIELDGGQAGSFASRRLGVGPIALVYNLYLDAAHGSVWGDGTGGSAAYGPVRPPEGSTTLPIYGLLPAHQDVSSGDYADSVTITLEL